MNDPAETTKCIDRQGMTADPGGRWAIGSLMCAALTLAVAPIVLGPLGVVAGALAVWKGARWRGTVGLSASAVAAVIGYYLAVGFTT